MKTTITKPPMNDVKLISASALLAMGCAQPAPPAVPAPGATPAQPAECSAQAAIALQGQPFGASLQAQAQRLSGARTVRVIRPGQAVTMDFNPFRLNIELDAEDRVIRLRCG